MGREPGGPGDWERRGPALQRSSHGAFPQIASLANATNALNVLNESVRGVPGGDRGGFLGKFAPGGPHGGEWFSWTLERNSWKSATQNSVPQRIRSRSPPSMTLCSIHTRAHKAY